MFFPSVDRAFRRFQESGDSKALAFVFDATAPELQRLARYFAGPEAPAEDLLQATYLTAIESKARFDGTQRVLPWLVGILANHARESRRRQRREIDPERVRADVGLDPSDAASASELSQTLDGAIARLPEVYRAVLRLYLEHGLEPAEIARSLERPQGTVRAQLSRGLKQLRHLLPESVLAAQAYALVSTPRLAEMRATVLAKNGAISAPIPNTTLFLGVFAMSLNKKLIAAALVLLVSLLSYRIWSVAALEDSSSSTAPVADARTQSALLTADTLAPAQLEARTEAPLSPEPAAIPAQPPKLAASLRVHVTDGDGIALPNIGIALRPQSELQNLAALLDFTPTDATGTATFLDIPAWQVVVESDRNAERRTVRFNRGEQKEVTIQLRGVRVEGSVVDDTGTPVVGASVWAHAERLDAVSIAQTDAHGAFAVAFVSPGIALQARREGFVPSKAHPVLGKENETWSVRLRLEGEATEVTGRVLDPEGAPAADAFVGFVPDAAKSLTPYDRNGPQVRAIQVRTGPDGSFRSREVPRGAVIVTAAGRNPIWTPASSRIEVGTTPEHVELRFQFGATLEGTITDAGKPQKDCSIFLFCSQPEMPASYLFNLLAMRNTTSDSQGRFRIVGIVPGQVEMRALRNGMEPVGQQTIPMAADEKCRWDLDCSASAGAPFEIAIEPSTPPSGFWFLRIDSKDPADRMVSIHPTEPAGRAQLKRLKDGRYKATVLYVPESGDMIPVLVHEFDAREKQLSLRVPAERIRFQAVRGRVLDASGVGQKDRSVQAHSLDNAEPFGVQRTTDANGNFSFAGLPPGRYTMNLLDGDAITVLREFTVVGDRAEDLGDLTVQ